MGGFATKFVIFLLRNSRISIEQRQILTSALLNKLGALPLRAKITLDVGGTVHVDGRSLSLEVARKLKEGSAMQLNNTARRFVRETVMFLAIKKGVHENNSPEQGLFAKAALWYMQEEDDLYTRLAQWGGQGDEE